MTHADCFNCGGAGFSVEGGDCPACKGTGKQAATTRERQADLRARRAMLGMTEVRGIFLPPELHPELKALAARILRRHEKATRSPLPATRSDDTDAR